MQIKTMLTESRTVSPVISVILTVATTVILAVTIGTLALGPSDQVGDTVPQAGSASNYDGTEPTIMHESGAQIGDDSIAIAGDVNVTNSSDANKWLTLGLGTISVDESVVVQDTDEDSFANGDTARVVRVSESGSSSTTLQRWTYNAWYRDQYHIPSHLTLHHSE